MRLCFNGFCLGPQRKCIKSVEAYCNATGDINGKNQKGKNSTVKRKRDRGREFDAVYDACIQCAHIYGSFYFIFLVLIDN